MAADANAFWWRQYEAVQRGPQLGGWRKWQRLLLMGRRLLLCGTSTILFPFARPVIPVQGSSSAVLHVTAHRAPAVLRASTTGS